MSVAAGLACNATSTVIQLPRLEMVIASGDGQFGVLGQDVGLPLRVLVRSETTGSPRADVSVVWEVTQGSASVLGVSTTVTDATGSTEVRVRIGASPSVVRVKATASGQMNASVSFQVFGVNRPTLAQVTPGTAAAGETVTLTGTDFSTLADQNVVLFSGVRGKVLGATSTSLQVEVPRCLPARDVAVRVQLGVVPSADSVSLTVTGGGQATSMAVREVLDVADDAGFVCHALEGGLGAEYLALVYSASAVGAASHPFTLTLLGSSALAMAESAPLHGQRSLLGVPASDPQAAWDQRLRTLEDSLVRSAPARRPSGAPRVGPAAAPPAAVPAVGELRTFNVLNPSGGFDQVMAEARHVGARAAIFVDLTAPPAPQGFDNADLAAFAARFDQVIYPVDTGTFGVPSDLDANERVIILFTPAVNRLTPPGSTGFVGGFFYGIDLLASSTGSNQGEIFYALVPDPAGTYSEPHNRQQVLQAVPAVLAHEFQHMVHFNERVLLRGAANQEALWLSEALAQMAEELVARAYTQLNDPNSAQLFRSGAVQRARRYLVGPDTVSLVVTAGQGSLAERGAGFLSLLYLEDQLGAEVLGRLTRTTRTGVANVQAETGAAWASLLANWWSANYLDGPGVETGPLTYPTIDLRAYLGGTFPLDPERVGPGDGSDTGSLPSSSVRYYLLRPSVGGTSTVRLGGEAGGASSSQAALRLRLIRIS
jgi:hypothetical protein